MNSKIDGFLALLLSKKYEHQSRRQFTSRLARGLFAAVGVAFVGLPTNARGEDDPKKNVEKTPDNCGLHGYLCSGPCDPNANGNKGSLGNPAAANSMWIACCKRDNGTWMCCQYADYCGVISQYYKDHKQECPGVDPEGRLWCGPPPRNNTDPWDYICTKVSCSETYQSLEECREKCIRGSNPFHFDCDTPNR